MQLSSKWHISMWRLQVPWLLTKTLKFTQSSSSSQLQAWSNNQFWTILKILKWHLYIRVLHLASTGSKNSKWPKGSKRSEILRWLQSNVQSCFTKEQQYKAKAKHWKKTLWKVLRKIEILNTVECYWWFYLLWRTTLKWISAIDNVEQSPAEHFPFFVV